MTSRLQRKQHRGHRQQLRLGYSDSHTESINQSLAGCYETLTVVVVAVGRASSHRSEVQPGAAGREADGRGGGRAALEVGMEKSWHWHQHFSHFK